MFVLLLILFTVVPAIEIGLFIEVGGRIGVPSTLAVILFTGVAGASLARSQGTRVLLDVQAALERGQMPTDELIEGAVVLFGGALLLTPGFLTDVSGLLCLIPPSRRVLAGLLRRWAARRVQVVGAGRVNAGGFRVRTGPVRPGPAAQRPRVDLDAGANLSAAEGPRTIDADFELLDDDPD